MKLCTAGESMSLIYEVSGWSSTCVEFSAQEHNDNSYLACARDDDSRLACTCNDDSYPASYIQ